ncbi:MAG: hypothetical protein BroJett018_45730 [Chloroflexota bacterium]|nr:MAG: hypothetical protein BroJett018_45730 [Chloroflexota bacterium]
MSSIRRIILLFGIPLAVLGLVIGSDDPPETIVRSTLLMGYLLIFGLAVMALLMLLEGV